MPSSRRAITAIVALASIVGFAIGHYAPRTIQPGNPAVTTPPSAANAERSYNRLWADDPNASASPRPSKPQAAAAEFIPSDAPMHSITETTAADLHPPGPASAPSH